jgi:hypothetical protein
MSILLKSNYLDTLNAILHNRNMSNYDEVRELRMIVLMIDGYWVSDPRSDKRHFVGHNSIAQGILLDRLAQALEALDRERTSDNYVLPTQERGRLYDTL